jgi:subtilisin
MNNDLSTRPMQTTGRYLVLLPENSGSAGIASITNATGTREIDDSAMSNIGVAVVTLDPNQLQSLRAAVAGSQPILAAEPEQIMYAIGSILINGDTANYLHGYKDGIGNLVSSLSNGAATWDLQATKAIGSRYSGKDCQGVAGFVEDLGGEGVRLAVNGSRNL